MFIDFILNLWVWRLGQIIKSKPNYFIFVIKDLGITTFFLGGISAWDPTIMPITR